MVETMNYQFDILRGDEFEGHLLWERLANHFVYVLVGAALPRGIRMGKVEVCVKRGRDALMLGELTPVICCQGVNAPRKRLEHA